MKSRIVLLSALATCCAMTSPAFAGMSLTGGFHNTNSYVGASVGLLQYDESGLSTLSPSVIELRAGIPLSSFLGLEARLGTGLSSDQSGGNSVGVGTFGGVYAKGSIALAPKFSVYGVAGLAAVNLHRDFRAGDTTNTGLSAGVGGDVQMTQKLDINFEWTYLPGGTGFSSDLVSVGVNYAL